MALAALLLAAGAGAALGRLLRLPLWPLTGAIAGAALANVVVGSPAETPSWWSLLAQVLVGAVVGSRVDVQVVRDFRRVLAPGALAVVVIVAVGLALGALLAAAGLADPVVAVFGMVPGGVGEMVAASTALGANGAVVAGIHLIRLLVLIAALPLLLRWARRRQEP